MRACPRRWMTSNPSWPGIWTSRNTRSGARASSAARVSAPSPGAARSSSLLERQAQRRHRPTARMRAALERRARAVKHPQTFARAVEAVTRHHRRRRESGTVVAYDELELVAGAPGEDLDET